MPIQRSLAFEVLLQDLRSRKWSLCTGDGNHLMFSRLREPEDKSDQKYVTIGGPKGLSPEEVDVILATSATPTQAAKRIWDRIVHGIQVSEEPAMPASVAELVQKKVEEAMAAIGPRILAAYKEARGDETPAAPTGTPKGLQPPQPAKKAIAAAGKLGLEDEAKQIADALGEKVKRTNDGLVNKVWLKFATLRYKKQQKQFVQTAPVDDAAQEVDEAKALAAAIDAAASNPI